MRRAAEPSSRRFAFRSVAFAAATAIACLYGGPSFALIVTTGDVGIDPIGTLGPGDTTLPGTSVWVGSPRLGALTVNSASFLQLARLSFGSGGVGEGTGTISGIGTRVELVGSGTGSQTQRLVLGDGGTGSLTVNGGAVLNTRGSQASCLFQNRFCDSFVGGAAGDTAILNVAGTGTQVLIGQSLFVAQPGLVTTGGSYGQPGRTTKGTVNVTEGALLSTDRAQIGPRHWSADSTGTEISNAVVNVWGTGSRWVVTGGKTVDQANGNVFDGGATILTANDPNAKAAINVTLGGVIEIKGQSGVYNGINLTTAAHGLGGGGHTDMLVSGSGSKVEFTGPNSYLQVGRSLGSAELKVLDGGVVEGLNFLSVGRSGATGVMEISGALSRVSVTSFAEAALAGSIRAPSVNIGRGGGTGTVTVKNGGMLEVIGGSEASGNGPNIQLGYGSAGSVGRLNIQGTSSLVQLLSSSLVNGGGPGEAMNPEVVVGRDVGNTGVLTIGGVGANAGGKLVMTGNAVSTSTDQRTTYLGIGGFSDTTLGGMGTATIAGAGSELRVQGVDAFVTVGRNAKGSLALSDQARFSTTIVNVGRAGSGDGTLTMDNSFMDLSGQFSSNPYGAGLSLGNRGGTGVATITNNSLVTITNPGSAGASINLGGTSLSPLGHGELTLSAGSKIDFVTAAGSASMTVGRDGSGIATITGVGSQIDLGDGTLNVAQLVTGTGTLTINGGGKVLAGVANIGGSSTTVAGGNGTTTVSGAGSELRVSGPAAFIGVGRGGVGSLDVSNGGKVSSTAMTIGRYSGVQGTTTVNKLTVNNSLIELSGQQTAGNLVGANLAIGNGGGAGVATITNTSTVNITNYTVANNAGANLIIGGSGNYPLGNGSLVLSGGSQINVLAAPGAASAPTLGAVTIGNDGTGTATLSGGSSINVGGGAAYVGRQVGSTGVLNMSGGSVLNAGFVGIGVSAAGTTNNTLGTAGGTGTLVLNNSTINTSRFELGAGSLLTGDGGVINAGAKGPVILAGTVKPGTSPGRLRINCDVTTIFGSQLILEIDQDGSSANFEIDQLIIGNDSKFNLRNMQIIFSFIGDTNPTDFANSQEGFNLDRFLKTVDAEGKDAGLSSLFNKNGNNYENWDAAVNTAFKFESSAFDVTQMDFDPVTGEVIIAASAIPEPATFALVLMALCLMAAARSRRRMYVH